MADATDLSTNFVVMSGQFDAGIVPVTDTLNREQPESGG